MFRIFFLLAVITSDYASAVERLERVHQIQSRYPSTKERVLPNGQSLSVQFEDAIRSPKSALFSADGKKLYVNSLEGHQTVVFEWPSLKRIRIIDHRFTARHAPLFKSDEATQLDYPNHPEKSNDSNIFRGKPVEMALSHQGRYLWVTYYRRDYDQSAQYPSAVAIIDTNRDQIVRVMATGPIPKFVAISPDGQYAAITNWGDNTIGLIDISSSDPNDFIYKHLLTVESKLSQVGLENTDRDKTCGFCLRGTAFSPDGRYLFVARMGIGGIAGFDLVEKRYLGTVLNVRSTPRHLILSKDGRHLFASSNSSGYITRFDLNSLIEDLISAKGRRIMGRAGREVFVGQGARTIELSPDGRFVFAAVSNASKLVSVNTASMQIVAETDLEPYPVGLAISTDGQFAVVTSQGKSGIGGNSVEVVRLESTESGLKTADP